MFLILTALCAFLLISCASQAKQKHLELGEGYLQKRKFHEAVMEFPAAAEIDKSSGAAFWGLARAQENLGEFSETVVNLRKAVEFDPQNLDAKAKLGNYFDDQFQNNSPLGKTVFSGKQRLGSRLRRHAPLLSKR